MTDLLTYLLQERHRIPNQVIIDCLVLARLKPSPSRRIPQAEMQEMLGTCNQSHLSHRLTRLKSECARNFDSFDPIAAGRYADEASTYGQELNRRRAA
jgi:hypothetical protein